MYEISIVYSCETFCPLDLVNCNLKFDWSLIVFNSKLIMLHFISYTSFPLNLARSERYNPFQPVRAMEAKHVKALIKV